MKFLAYLFKIIKTIYVFLLYIIHAVYEFFQIHKTKVNPYKLRMARHKLRWSSQTKPSLGSVSRVKIRKRSGSVKIPLFSALLHKMLHGSRGFYILCAGVLLIVSIIVYVIFFSALFRVNTITITSTSEQNKEIVNQYIDKNTKNNKLPQNTLFFSLRDIKNEILQQHPTIADIHITKSLPNSVDIRVIQRTRAGIWCADFTQDPVLPVDVIPDPLQEDEEETRENTNNAQEEQREETTNEQQPIQVQPIPPQASNTPPKPMQCFYYGHDGVIFQKAPQTSRGFLIHEVRDRRYKDASATIAQSSQTNEQKQTEQLLENTVVYLGDQVLTKQDMEQIDLLYVALTMGVESPTYLTIVDEYEIRAGFPKGWEVYVSRQDPFVRQVENLAVVLEKHIKNNERFLEYIDVRYGNKIFYKYIAL